jgi:hypothetical protein
MITAEEAKHRSWLAIDKHRAKELKTVIYKLENPTSAQSRHGRIYTEKLYPETIKTLKQQGFKVRGSSWNEPRHTCIYWAIE